MRWYVYIIRSEARGVLYCGISTDLDRRLHRHNGLAKGGAKATRAGRPWRLAYLEGPMSKGDALRREAAIKRLSRSQKVALVAANPV